jgi:hypothetical protein
MLAAAPVTLRGPPEAETTETAPPEASIVKAPVMVTPWEQIRYGLPAASQVVAVEMAPQTAVPPSLETATVTVLVAVALDPPTSSTETATEYAPGLK